MSQSENSHRVGSDSRSEGGGFPTRPNFEALDAVSPSTEDRRTFLLALIGNLAFVWSNNESMFIYLIKVLLRIDEPAAVIVFATLTTARSRIELVERLSGCRLAGTALEAELKRLLDSFETCTRVRNEFNHCLYSLDAAGSMVATRSFRIRGVGGVPTLESAKPIDEARITELVATIEAMKAFNRDLWDLLPRLEAHLAP